MARRFRLPKSVREAAEWYAHYISPLSLVAGFLIDFFFLAKRVDVPLTHVLIVSYLILSAVCIILINLIYAGRIMQFVKALPILPVAVQFAFGGLFSAYLSLYGRSLGFTLSWIFIATVVALLLFNERFSHTYARFSVQLPIYFTALFAYLIFLLPLMLHRIGPSLFFAAGIISIIAIALLLKTLYILTPQIVTESFKQTLIAIFGVFVAFNVLYFANIIPPLPLALKEGGVYHSISKQPDGGYLLVGEQDAWYSQYLPVTKVYHRVGGGPVYVWSAVFAPSQLTTDIRHQWQRFDTQSGAWITTFTVRFPIVGGRSGGYAGFSESLNPPPGRWRVNVTTLSGQVIGRIDFDIVEASTTPPLVTLMR